MNFVKFVKGKLSTRNKIQDISVDIYGYCHFIRRYLEVVDNLFISLSSIRNVWLVVLL